MKFFKLTTIASLLCCVCIANAQTSASKQLKSATYKKTMTKLVAENEALLESQKKLITALNESRDSLRTELTNNRNFANFVKRLTAENRGFQAEFEKKNTKIEQLSASLQSAEDKITQMNYEIEILKDSKITQVYDESLDAVKAKFIERMGAKNANFQFDESEDNNFTISKVIDGSSEAWFDFDKAMNVLLEMKAKFQPHKFDKNRTLVYITTNLSEKTRFSNKQFTPTTDNERIKLYNTKMIDLLAADLKKSK